MKTALLLETYRLHSEIKSNFESLNWNSILCKVELKVYTYIQDKININRSHKKLYIYI